MKQYTCPQCGGYAPPRPFHISHRLHAALTVASLGLWGLSWLALVVSRRFLPLECPRCGTRLPAAFNHFQAKDGEEDLTEIVESFFHDEALPAEAVSATKPSETLSV